MAALHADNNLLRVAFQIVEEFQPVDTSVSAFLLTLKRLGIDKGNCPPLELVLVAFGQIAGRVDVFWGAVNVKFALRAERIL